VHPEYHIVFDAKNLIWRQLSSSDVKFHIEDLFEFNHWDTVCAARKEILSEHSFESTDTDSGFGFEDWLFNCQTLAEDIEHHVVPNTVHFTRVKKTGSRLAYDNQSDRLIRPTKLFEPVRISRMLEEENSRRGSSIGNEKKSDKRIVREKKILAKFYQLINSFQYRFYRPLTFFLRPIFRLFPILFKLVKRFRDVTSVATTPPVILPKWLIDEWKAIHTIEPQVFPERWLIEMVPFYEIPRSRIGKPYIVLCELYGANVSHVFLVPWLKRGGADLVTLNYVEALVKYGLGNDVLVIATENADSPWATRLPESARFIEFGKMCSYLSRDEQEKLLTRVLLQMAPQVVHNINSDLGYRIFVKYGNALKSISNLYVDTYCKDVTEEGKSVGYPFLYLPECFDYLKGIASDNQSFLTHLQEIYAFDRQKLFVHYQPIQNRQKRGRKDTLLEKSHLNILWAGRMDRQKRPDILERIAVACRGLPFRFHIYGTSLLDADNVTDRLKGLKNVTYYGSYDGLASLPTEKYDLFLYTSQWDGLPNVLMEAISLGLPVIASDVGGVGELIVTGKTGFLIDPYDDVGAYVECLQRIYTDRSQLHFMINNAYALIDSRHSWDRFVENLKRFPGYVVNR
jgi:glycosyltransferase involved in cell wall biosynthesis